VYALALPLVLFLVLLMFQLTPLPPALLKRLSPTTYELYSLTLPGWPDTQATLSTQQNVPAVSRTLSLYPYATRLELYKFLAYAGLFFLVVNTLRTHRQIRAVCLVIVGTAAVMALVGIVQKLSGTSAIYWFRDTSYVNFFGPYINRNHLLGIRPWRFYLAWGCSSSSLPRLASRGHRYGASVCSGGLVSWRRDVVCWCMPWR